MSVRRSNDPAKAAKQKAWAGRGFKEPKPLKVGDRVRLPYEKHHRVVVAVHGPRPEDVVLKDNWFPRPGAVAIIKRSEERNAALRKVVDRKPIRDMIPLTGAGCEKLLKALAEGFKREGYGICEKRRGVWHVSTHGWSENELALADLRQNNLFWLLCWQTSRRGGHYTFKVPATL